MINYDEYMKIAIKEATLSLQEGNHGFGAVIVDNGKIIVRSHDREETQNDPTSHAEINAIREASKIKGKNLYGCILISTHEPCPMCATAIVWSGIRKIAYGYSIDDAIKEGRNRIELFCKEIFKRSGKNIEVHSDILKDQCSLLYNREVRYEVKKLRNITEEKLDYFNAESTRKRLDWFKKNIKKSTFINKNLLELAHSLLLKKFNIEEREAPIYKQTEDYIVFHSKNFCPTLEACKILDLDTRFICKRYNEDSTDILIKQIDERLNFSRNYDKLRPYSEYCEEMISISR